jgi:hypothetical protein
VLSLKLVIVIYPVEFNDLAHRAAPAAKLACVDDTKFEEFQDGQRADIN